VAVQRFRHGFTVFRFQPVWRAMAWLLMPSAASRRIVARCFQGRALCVRRGKTINHCRTFSLSIMTAACRRIRHRFLSGLAMHV
jgi:hypothetical protein